MSDENAREYDLADVPEPPKKRPAPPPEKPLPRLWKTEPEDDGEEQPSRARQAKPEAADAIAAPADRSSDERRRSKAEKSKAAKKPAQPDGSEKKVLIEETPALDTYEARQRARLLLGGLVAGCCLIFGWICYQLFLHDPMAIEQTGDEPIPTAAAAPPKRDLDAEARAMLKRAEENAKAGRTNEAIALLENVAKSYNGTQTAAEAKEALDRPKNNLPLFLDRPTVKAEIAPPAEPPPPPAPPAIVKVEPKQVAGNATLTLPANPGELTPTHASPLAMGPAPAPASASPTGAPIRPLPEGFRAVPEAGVHRSGWPLVIQGRRDGAPMVLVPGGTFLLGNDGGPPAEAPSHKVRLSTFYIDQHEVTVRQFVVFLSESRYRGQPPRGWSDDIRKIPSESHPMIMVNARDAQAYAEWAHKQLPTEAQWEAAARSIDGRLYPWGSDPKAGGRPAGDWKLQPVKATPADVSPYGAYDMGGNVLEWTRDWYDSRYYHQLPVGDVDNPSGPANRPRSLEVVIKGDRKLGSASSRQGLMLEKRLNHVGFRCVLPVTEQASVVAGTAAPASVPPVGAPGQPPANRPGQGTQSEPPPPF
jgi:formylglycine-generating enzyme required for sulfatase activity